MRILMIALLLLLAACADDAPANKRASEARQLQPGEYDVVAKVTELSSTDKSTPTTRLKVGASTSARGCVAADGTPDPALFAEAGDVCKTSSSYVSGAILNLALACTRKSNPGNVSSAVDGQFTASAFTAKVTTGTSFVGNGDYRLVRDLTGKRIGNCPAKKS